MKKTTFMRNLNRKTRRIIFASAAGLAAAGILAFALLFRVTAVEVVGNTRFTEQEIREMALTGPFAWNTLLIEKFHSHVDPEEALIESIDIERVSNNKVVIRVNEKQLIGYVQFEGNDWYFDAEGIVLECTETAADSAEAGPAAESTDGASESADAESQEDVLAPQSVDGGEEEAGSTEEETSAQFYPALTNIPLVTGLSFDRAVVGEQLPVENTKVFNTIHGIARMVDKYDIVPDSVEFSADYDMILHYGNVRVQLGQDEELEEKLIRVAAILPSIRNLSGVLHMEDFTPSTENIIFEKDLTEAEQQTQEEAAQQRMEEQAQEDGESETGEAGADAQSGEDAETDGSGTETQDDDSGAGSEADGV